MNPSEKELFRSADQMPPALWDDLCKRDPRQAADAAGARWDGRSFCLTLIGIDYAIDPENRRITKTNPDGRSVSYQAGVVLLTTLAGSLGVPPSGRMAGPQELPGGRMFFTGAHALATGPLARAFERDPDQLIRRAVELGGESIEGADAAIRLPGLPRVPLYVLLWQGDSECPPRAFIGIDDRAHFHLDLAGVFALTNLLVNRLCRAILENR